MPKFESLGEWVSKTFKTQKKAAEALSTTQSVISQWVSGERVPSEERQTDLRARGFDGPFPTREIGAALLQESETQSMVVTGALPEHVEEAYIILCEILDLKQKTPADGDRRVVARILGKAARELARGTPQEEVRRELLTDAELFLRILT